MEDGQYGISGRPAQKFQKKFQKKWLPPKEDQEDAQILHQRMGEELAREMTFK